MRITFWAVIALAAVLHAELANEDKAYGALHGRIAERIRLWPDLAPHETKSDPGRYTFDERVKVWRRCDVSQPELVILKPDEPMPKLNFSTCHDSWLKDYHRMVSSQTHYKVVADIIADVCAIFDKPALFHLGFDEEVPVAGKGLFHAVYRQGDLWWHDLLYTVKMDKHY